VFNKHRSAQERPALRAVMVSKRCNDVEFTREYLFIYIEFSSSLDEGAVAR
jgi:hypothetical protein